MYGTLSYYTVLNWTVMYLTIKYCTVIIIFFMFGWFDKKSEILCDKSLRIVYEWAL